MEKYITKKANKDFIFLTDVIINKGSREKRLVYDLKEKEKAIFKYQSYECTEACSEKMSYEIAKRLGYPCAKIEFAYDENGTLGILNYLFISKTGVQHTDAVAYINNREDRKEFYTIENIENCLNKIDYKLFKDFLKIMVFDALVGETDRHEENWGISYNNGKYQISPLYDNGCNLLREYKDKNKIIENWENGKRDFNAYINRSKTLIYNSKNNKKYTHFELIKQLYKQYKKEIKKEIENLNKITNKEFEKIVRRIPNEFMSDMQKTYIIKYLILRKEKLLEIIKDENILKDGE